MCRTTDYGGYHPQRRLKITGIHLRLSLSTASNTDILPDSLTLLLLRRISDAPLHLNGSKIPSDSPVFVSLHRVLAYDDVVFSSDDRIRVSDGLSFEVHVAGGRLLKGVFRRDGEIGWTVECKCDGDVAGIDVGEAELSVATENGGVMREKVAVERCRRRWRGFKMGLEDIPEERDECCCCGCESDGEDEERENESDGEDDVFDEEKQSVGWAVDVGFWAVCLGVGLLVTSTRFRPRKLFFLKSN